MKYWVVIDADYNPVRTEVLDGKITLVNSDYKGTKTFDNLEDAYERMSQLNKLINGGVDDRIKVKPPLQIGVMEVDVVIYPQDNTINL